MSRTLTDKPFSYAGLNGCARDFPVLNQEIHGNRLVFLDSAASAQRPQQVLDAVHHYETHDHANVHRGVHTLSQRATDAYEGARKNLAHFIGAATEKELVFVRGTTEAINLVANAFLAPRLESGDEILVTELEHHANIVPWQLLAERQGAKLVIVPINDRGEISVDDFKERLSSRTKLAAIAHVSNALGTVLPVAELCAVAREKNVPVLVDGAQGVPHGSVNVEGLGCDFYAFSAHKMYGPTGIGALYAKTERLEQMQPWQGGGDMILEVDFAGTTYNDIPFRFEAGTPNISGTVGMTAAAAYLSALGPDNIHNYESDLLAYATNALLAVDGINLVGTASNKASVLSFSMDGAHPHDIGTILDHQGVAIRTGHHCAMPVMKRFGLPGTARASIGVYNGTDDIDQLVEGLVLCKKMLS
ncbi:MAG: cysteine desulfurase [Pseudomonadota bacterium]